MSSLLIVNAAGSPVGSSTTAIFTFVLRDVFGNPVPGSGLATMTLTIADTATGQVINAVSQVNILNTGRGVLDEAGNLTVTLQAGDTALAELAVPVQTQRSLVIRWTDLAGGSWWHQCNFLIDPPAA